MTAISPVRNNYVVVSDNGTELVRIPATQAAGVYVIPLEVASKGAITATCSGNSNCRVVGLFSTYT
jgi:hypothetical protein